jgi:adenosine deaminase
MKSAFIPYDERYRLITETIKPWYAAQTTNQK